MREDNEQLSPDEKVADRLITLTIDEELGWKPYYGQVQIGASAPEMQEATAPRAFLLTEEAPEAFGMVALHMRNSMEEIVPEDPKLFVNGDEVEVDERRLETLVEAINVYLRDVRAGEVKSKKQQYEAREQKLRQQYQQQLQSAYAQIDAQEERIDQLVAAIDRLSGMADPKPPRPKMTVDELKEVVWELYSDQYDIPRSVFERNFDTAEASHILRQKSLT